jgi:hypothetical protein
LYWAILYWAFAIYYDFSNKNKDELSMYAKYSGLGEGGMRGFSGEIPLESRRQNVHDFSSDTIESNTDFLNAVTTALMTPPDKTTDMNSIYKLEVQIANIQTENARKLLSEMGNPNVSKKPRSFLQYMNWYGINCPIDSNICVNVV